MNRRGDAIATRRLRAPQEDRSTLIDPPLGAVGDVLAENQRLAAVRDYDLQGQPLGQVAADARRQLIDAAYDYTRGYRDVERPRSTERVLLAGHQPVLFHPGVWFKNFTLAALGNVHDAVAVNLVIDNDTSKTSAVRVPGGDVARPVVEEIAYDRLSAEIPHEERAIQDRDLLGTFAQRVLQRIAPLVPDPLVKDYWPRVLQRSEETDNLGACLSQARHQLEAEFGGSTLEIPQSRVCELPAFYQFTAHLLAQLPRLREIYNETLLVYRSANRIRSANHPVPELAADGEWLEAPFWLWQADAPRRRRLFARRQGETLALSDRRELTIDLPLAADGDADRAVEVLAGLAGRGIKLRSRALITTLFARLMLGDLFLHGIGGAKYDELTDALIRRFFGFEPPAFMVVSATLQLPIDRPLVKADDLRRTDQLLRELVYHPERFLADESPVDVAPHRACRTAPELMAAKRAWVETEPTRQTARQRCREIRRLNEALQPCVETQRRHLQAQRERLAEALRAERILAWREYAFCLYPATTLRDFLLAFLPATL